jgi:hypothetical protein
MFKLVEKLLLAQSGSLNRSLAVRRRGGAIALLERPVADVDAHGAAAVDNGLHEKPQPC